MGGLMDYKARFYSPYLNHFIQPDTLIPDPTNPQAWNRFGYTYNNPIKYTDPTGHDPIPDFINGFLLEAGRTLLWYSPYHQEVGAIQSNESDAMLAGRLVADIASVVIGGVGVGTGTGGIVGGGGLCVSGFGCVAGAPAIAVSSTLIVQGAGMGVRGAEGIATILALFAKRSNVQENKKRGDAYRDEIAEQFEQEGYTVRKEVVKKTIFGKRIIDIEIISPDGKVLGGIETKVGNSRYTASQRAKDFWLWINDGYKVNVVRKK